MSRAVCAVILVMSVLTIGAAPALAQTSGPPYTLTFTPPTGGKVQGAGINCGAGGTACSVTMPAAMTLGLSATASAGYTFTAWTGDCTGTTVSLWLALGGPRACGATFTPVGGVAPTTPVITWATPAPITQGTALTAVQLNATTSVAGAFVYTPAAGTMLAVGSHTLSTTFTPANTSLYTSATKTVTLVVNAPAGPTTPVITWATPAPITAGTALSATQLNATTTAPGSFVYTPAAGAVLSAGSHALTATFTPTDPTLYTSASKTVTLVVNATVSSGALSVYDATDALIGPLVYLDTVTFSVDGHRYAAGVSPDGWILANTRLYFFDAACSGQPYTLRTFLAVGEPLQPAPLARTFFRSLFLVVGSAGYYDTGQYVRHVISSAVPNLWYRDSGSGPCTPVADAGTAWFDETGAVQLSAHQPPFTIR